LRGQRPVITFSRRPLSRRPLSRRPLSRRPESRRLVSRRLVSRRSLSRLFCFVSAPVYTDVSAAETPAYTGTETKKFRLAADGLSCALLGCPTWELLWRQRLRCDYFLRLHSLCLRKHRCSARRGLGNGAWPCRLGAESQVDLTTTWQCRLRAEHPDRLATARSGVHVPSRAKASTRRRRREGGARCLKCESSKPSKFRMYHKRVKYSGRC
jgi:hypothetical protein